ncbi:hypothetical protein CAEBREN_19000 [Caenorhabditis brenneri]|uniref:Nuclear transport factor 2 family protein n=1 Tax=Caenorhabditis brenneri TaxID=135651 RepID=G0N056_CAEBE|nr:hypothetical protein CAEBREN_19000 [Caenorhabditis brenneri]
MKLLFCIFLLLTLLSTSASSAAPDDITETHLRGWVADLQKGVQSKNKTAISSLFFDHASMAICANDKEDKVKPWKAKWLSGNELFEYLVNNGTNARFYFNKQELGGRKAMVTVTGLGPEFIAHYYFQKEKGVLVSMGGEYLACGQATYNCD